MAQCCKHSFDMPWSCWNDDQEVTIVLQAHLMLCMLQLESGAQPVYKKLMAFSDVLLVQLGKLVAPAALYVIQLSPDTR